MAQKIGESPRTLWPSGTLNLREPRLAPLKLKPPKIVKPRAIGHKAVSLSSLAKVMK